MNKIYLGDSLSVLKTLPNESVDCCVTSPPYWGLRDYGVEGQLGLEKTPEEYVSRLVEIFGEVKRVLKKEGTLWLNLGDTYSAHKDCKSVKQTISKNNAHVIEKGLSVSRNSKILKSVGLKNKDLVGIPWMAAFALRADGWYLRQDIIWHKPNPMPESVKDRCTKAHEYIFLLSKSKKYYYDYEAIQEIATGYDGRKDTKFKGGVKYKGFNQQTMLSRGHERWKFKNLKNTDGLSDELYPVRNKRSVWTVNTKPYKEAHFAVFPEKLIEPCILAGCPVGGVVLDPFIGSGTTAIVALKQNKNYIGIELNPEYIKLAEKRIADNIKKHEISKQQLTIKMIDIDFQDKLDDMEKEFDAKCEQADLDWADRTQDNETDEN